MTIEGMKLDRLVQQALEEARDFAVGEVQPRLVPTETGGILHTSTSENQWGTDLKLDRSSLLVDVGWPREFVRFDVQTRSNGKLALQRPILWRYKEKVSVTSHGPLSYYVMLFDEWRTTLHDRPVV